LSDDNNDLTQWIFPDTSISAHSYLIVWVDEDPAQTGLHADFKISASGEAIYLSDMNAAVIDDVTFGAQNVDISYGRFPNGTGAFRTMYPTFSEANLNYGPGDTVETQTVFGDTLIHTINLHFYVEHWQDTLQYNYEVLDEEYMPVRLTFDNTVVLDSVGIRYKGHSSYEMSRNTPKKPFELKFGEYRDDQMLYGLKKLNLQNCVSDPSFMRETIGYGIARRFLPASRTAYSNVNVDGDLLGFYVLAEQIDKIFLSKYFANNGGNLYKSGDDGGTLEYRGADPTAYYAEYELKTNEEENDWSGFVALLDRLNNTANNVFVDTMQNWLNLDGCIRVMAFNMVLSNYDSYTGSSRNFYFYDDATSGQFHMIPWDLNESFGVYQNGWDVITQDIVNITNLNDRPLSRRILENDSLRQVYFQYIREMIDGPAAADSIASKINLLKPIIQSYVEADPNKLYTNQNFINNLESDVFVDIGRRIPGLKAFSQARNLNLGLQISNDRVYPGDADNNGVVNALDILPIGIYFLQTGMPRDSVTFQWGAHRALLWNSSAATYADANGDGAVDEKDVVAIGVNWNNQHSASVKSFEIDPNDKILLSAYRSAFTTLYNSLSGENEATSSMRALLSSMMGLDEPTPAVFELEQNYPNPFNMETTIAFSLAAKQEIRMQIVNILGQVVCTPISDQIYEAGKHSYHFDASCLSSGIYFYRLETVQGNKLCKMILLK
jgi:spore coat protein CotH